MTKLTRLTGKLFGETATATGDNPQIGQFGSGLAGTYVGTTDVATIQNLTAWSNGFIGSVTPDTQYPPLPEMTGFGKVLSYQQNYLLQQGIAEWDSATTYYTNSYCSYNGIIYVSLEDENTNNNPSSTPTKWAVYGSALFANPSLGNLNAAGQAVIDNKANIALGNLSSVGENRLHALKGYLDDGTLLTDSEGLADVKSYAHSTFDSTKFTVTGSPTITDDGVVSGFSSSNYINTPAIDLVNKTFKLEIVGKTPSTFSEGVQYGLFSFRNANYGICRIYIDSDRRFASDFVVNGSGVAYTAGSLQSVLPDTWYKIELEQTASQFSLKYTNLATGVIVAPSPASNSTLINNTTYPNYAFRIGIDVYSSSQFNWENGLIDLKQFSITVDGVPVFSGNKTSIDTIKTDDYTVVGSPTITADGIASGFSTGNNIKTTLTTFNNNSILKITESFKLPNSRPVTNGYLYFISAGNTKLNTQLYSNTNSQLVLYAYDGSTTGTVSIDVSAHLGKQIFCVCEVSNNSRKLSVYSSDGTLISSSSNTNTLTWAGIDSEVAVWLGSTSANTYFYSESIDLNAFKIYVDGNLIYQPCLKIPYTLSKTGSKVVDSYYRPRVEDMYNQFGYAPYYTLSDSDFTLPMGEVYGLIGNNTTAINTKVNISDVNSYGAPDFANGESRAYNTLYQASANGWLYSYSTLFAAANATNFGADNDIAITTHVGDSSDLSVSQAVYFNRARCTWDDSTHTVSIRTGNATLVRVYKGQYYKMYTQVQTSGTSIEDAVFVFYPCKTTI